jgi:hypothetical protein
MPIIDGPYRDPAENRPPRRRKTPKALIRLRRQFTYERQLEVFRRTFEREPANDDELEAFADEYIREMYNSGADEL